MGLYATGAGADLATLPLRAALRLWLLAWPGALADRAGRSTRHRAGRPRGDRLAKSGVCRIRKGARLAGPCQQRGRNTESGLRTTGPVPGFTDETTYCRTAPTGDGERTSCAQHFPDSR